MASYIFVTLLFSVSLLLVITWFKSEELFKNGVKSLSFSISPHPSSIPFVSGFDNREVENLLRLINGLSEEQKVAIRETPKNKQTGSIYFLFIFWVLLFVVASLGRIRNPKEVLNMIISQRFTFQNSEINSGTLPSSYSKWCSATHEGNYDLVR